MSADLLTGKINSVLRKVIDMQISDNEPPETRVIMEALIGSGIRPEQCYGAIGSVLAEEYKQMYAGHAFNYDRYRENLLALRGKINP